MYGQGLNGLLGVSKALHGLDISAYGDVVKAVVDVEWTSREEQRNDTSIALFDLRKAESAILKLRQSLENSSTYEHLWLESGISSIINFSRDGTLTDEASLKPALKILVAITADNAETSIRNEEAEEARQVRASTVSGSTREALQVAISSWAEFAHRELRDKLENAFQDRSWRKLAWWKLIWRVDDVNMIAGDALQRAYLVDAEKGLIWLSGRIQEAGLAGTYEPPRLKPEIKRSFTDRIPDLTLGEARRIASNTSSASRPVKAPRPWPTDIEASRSDLLADTIPPLQALAQRLLLEAISTGALASTLSLLVYISISTTSVYESGAIAALGLAWSARRMQTRWERAKLQWIEKVTLDGRKVLGVIEKKFRTAVKLGGQARPYVQAVGDREEARNCLSRVRAALEKL